MSPEELAAIRERWTCGPRQPYTAVIQALLAEIDRIAAELTAERAKVERVEALCERMEAGECLCRGGANQYGQFFIPQPNCPGHGHHSAMFRAALDGAA